MASPKELSNDGAQYAGLSSAAFGVIGTSILFFSSYALQPFEGGIFGSDSLTESNNRIRVKNFNRLRRQAVFGLVLRFAQGVLVADDGMGNAVQQHIHLAD